MNVEIEIELLAQTRVNYTAVRRWLEKMNVSPDGVEATIDMITAGGDAAGLVALAAKQCYMAFEPGLNPNVSRVRSEIVGYLENILKSGHGSVLEHAVFSFGITGVSRVFTGEMNRHRAGWAISERSGRFIRFGDGIPWWCPPSIRANPLTETESDELAVLLDERSRLASESGLTDLDPARSTRLAELEARVRLEELKLMTRDSFGRQFDMQAHEYAHLVSLWDLDSTDRNFEYKKKITSLLRRPIGMGYAGGGVWTGNARALRHVLALRTSPAAEEEIAYVFSHIASAMAEAEPALFGDFKFDSATGAWVPAYPKV